MVNTRSRLYFQPLHALVATVKLMCSLYISLYSDFTDFNNMIILLAASAAGAAAAAPSASNQLASANSTGQQGGMLLSIFDLDDTAGASTSQVR